MTIQVNPVASVIFFSVFVDKKLAYTKYNFNFNLYCADFNLTLPTSNSGKISVFNDFFKRNVCYFDKPYTVLPELTKYFLPMTQEIIDYMNKYGYWNHPGYMTVRVPDSYVGRTSTQFDLINYTDTQVRRLQDYYWNADGRLDTKWNFDFASYSDDFNIYGSKLFIFTDFTVRCNVLSGSPPGYIGYGTYESFQKYFIQDDSLAEYIIENGVTSIYSNISKSLPNIDFLAYQSSNPDIGLEIFRTVDELRDHYLCYGQFQRLNVPLIEKPLTAIQKVQNSIGTVFSGDEIGTCFLYSNGIADPNLYLVTCFHVVKEQKKIDVVYATFEIKSNTRVPISKTAAFRMVGYDEYTDLYIAIFDSELSYNAVRGVTLTDFSPLKISLEYNLNRNDKIVTLCNMGFVTNMVCIQGEVMDPHYSGPFDTENVLAYPDSILTNLPIVKGASGSPLLFGDPNSTTNELICVGMLNFLLLNNDSYCSAVNSFIMTTLIANSIGRFFTYQNIFKNDIQKLNYQLKNSITKKWLGIICDYFHPVSSVAKNPALASLDWDGGLVIHDFILGYNYVEREFITDFQDVLDQGIIKINTPLLNTKMYSRFIYGSKTPIVLKSIQYFDVLISEYNKFYFGKFSNQVSYSIITYGLLQTASVYVSSISSTEYTNTLASEYGDLILEYYYFNGLEWVLDTEIISGNKIDKYNEYTDNLGYKYLQHNLELPFILIPYLKFFFNNTQEIMPVDHGGSHGFVNPDTQDNLVSKKYIPRIPKYNRTGQPIKPANFN